MYELTQAAQKLSFAPIQVFKGFYNFNIQLSMCRRLVAEPICLNSFKANEYFFFSILACETLAVLIYIP